jgi:hypothetical protein
LAEHTEAPMSETTAATRTIVILMISSFCQDTICFEHYIMILTFEKGKVDGGRIAGHTLPA